MPANRARPIGEELVDIVIAGRAVHDVDLRVALGSPGRGVDVVTTEEATEVQGIRDRELGEILVSESDNLALGHEARELRLALVGKRAKLDAANFRAGGRGEVGDGDALAKEFGVGRVGGEAWVGELEGF